MEKKEQKQNLPSNTEKEKVSNEVCSDTIKNANAAGDGAMERKDEDLSVSKDGDQKNIESNY
jgi:hypothetical protein